MHANCAVGVWQSGGAVYVNSAGQLAISVSSASDLTGNGASYGGAVAGHSNSQINISTSTLSGGRAWAVSAPGCDEHHAI